MNEQGKHETLADIVAEMRGRDVIMQPRYFADRIEAATKREHPDGNAAAMREALNKLVGVITDYYGWDDAPAVHDLDGPEAYFCAEVSQAMAALSAPPRNCDRFETADGARREWDMIAPLEEGDAFDWLFEMAGE